MAKKRGSNGKNQSQCSTCGHSKIAIKDSLGMYFCNNGITFDAIKQIRELNLNVDDDIPLTISLDKFKFSVLQNRLNKKSLSKITGEYDK